MAIGLQKQFVGLVRHEPHLNENDGRIERPQHDEIA
jgi:hypothetical protein